MDQGLKERLIGAAVLVAIAVVVVPWVLDGDGERAGEPVPSLALPVPEQPLPVQRQTLNLDTDAAPMPPVPADRAAAAAADVGGAANAANASNAPSERPSQAAETAAREPAAQPEAAAPRGERRDAAPEPARQAAATPQPSSGEAPATRRDAAATPPATNRTAAAAPAGAFQVQLGSFSEEENARRLVQRVATFGYKAAVSTTKSNGRTMYRVRVGPHATREEASAVASSLSAHGFVAQVVTAD